MSEHQPPEQPRATPDHHETLPPESNPRIWVGSLADYNAGHLHGDWLDAAVPAEDLAAAVQQMLRRSQEPNAEEWGIFDYDNFGAYQPGEYEDLATVAAIARGITSHGFAFAAWASVSETDLEDLETDFEEAYLGFFESVEGFVGSVLDDFDARRTLDDALPAWLAPHVRIDHHAIARDLQADGLHIEPASDGGIYVFRM